MMVVAKPYTNLKTAFFAAVLAAAIFIFLFVYIGINQRKISYEDSKLLTKEISHKAASETERYFALSQLIARSMVQHGIIYQKLGGNRQEIANMLYDNLKQNKNFLATWTMWEHNSFDGQDEAYCNNEIYDTLGNLSVTFFQYKDTILLEQTNPQDYSQDYYTIPKTTKSELIIEPYYYQYQGHPFNFYETSVVVPIFIDSVFCGVFGVDINLDSLQRSLNKVRIFDKGYLSLISHDGVIISHSDSNAVYKNFYTTINPKDTLSKNAIQQGKEYSLETISEFTGEKVFRFFYPINVGDGKKPWSLMVEIPVNSATSRSKQLLVVAFGSLLIGLLLVVFLVFNVIDRRRYDKLMNQAFREVEERTKAAEESAQSYLEIFNSTSEAIFIHDAKTGKILDVNSIMLHMYGYDSKEEVLKLSIPDFSSHTNSLNEISAEVYMTKALLEGPQVFEWHAKKKNGELFWIEVSLKSSILGGFNRILAVVRDISDRKNAQQAIIQNEKKFRELAELLPQVVWEANLNSKFTYTNKKGLDLFGYTQNEIEAGIGILDVIIPEHRDTATENIIRLFQDDIVADSEYMGLKKDGTKFPIEIYSSVIYSDGKPVGLRGITIDISDRKNSERALAESEEKYRTLMESMNEVVIMADNNHIIHYVNKKFTEKLGYLPEEIVGKEGYKMLHDPEDLKMVENANVDRVNKKGSSYELTFKAKDGHKIDFLVSGAPLFDSEGNTYGSIGSMMDISEWKKAENALVESEEKYRTLMENMNEVVMMVDNDDRVLFVNRKFTEKLGYQPEEIINKIGYEVLLSPEDKRKIIAANNDRLSRKISQYEASFITKDGRKIEFLVSGAPMLDNKGNTIGSIGAMMDITERKIAEKALQESQLLFETLAKMAPVGIFRTRADGYTTYVNPKWCELSGVSFDEAQGDGWFKAVHPDDRENIRNGWNQKTQNLENSTAEYRFIRSDGTIVWVLGNALPEIVDGNIKGYIGTITNITDIKNAQEEIVRSEKKFRDMANLLPQTIWEADTNGKITFTNNNGYKFLGYSSEDFENGIYMISLIIPEDRERALQNIYRRFNNEKSVGEEYMALRKDGTTYPVQIFTSPILENNVPVGIRGISIDITEAKKAQKELQDSEQRYRTIIEAFPDIIMISDLAGNIIFANEVLERITGIKPDEYNSPNRKAHIHPDDIKLVKNAIAGLVNSEKLHTDIIENRFIDSWGNTHWFSGIISKLNFNNQILLQTITRDITEKKKIEEELTKYRNHLEMLVKERTEELEAANEELQSINEEIFDQREKLHFTLKQLQDTQKQLIQVEKMASLGVLAAGIAHEINNPLNFIQGGICGLESYIKEILPNHLDETTPLIEAIHEGIRRSAEIVQSLNRYSRQDDFPKAASNINTIIDSCLVMVHSKTKDRVAIVKDYNSGELLLLCNEGKIHQAFLNILVNAIDAIDGKGIIQIKTIQVDRFVKVLISDNGCGISKDELSKITDPFYTTKAPGKGTGLGLSITYNIISEHSGTIEFESEVGVGTTVTVSLPY